MDEQTLWDGCKIEYIEGLPVKALYVAEENILYIRTGQSHCVEKIKDACRN